MITPFELNADFQYALNVFEKTFNSVFLTGRAGTGKSTLLSLFRHTSRKQCVVLAPTGVAALNVQGQTIHSFFGFPGKFITPADIRIRRDKAFTFRKLETLIIDEVSMVRADIIDCIDYALRVSRNNNAPFGGVQMIFIGDLFQLPPIVSSPEEKLFFQQHYDSPHFFSANVFKKGFRYEMIELKKVYRQSERHFVRLLDAVREGELDYDDLEVLNERFIGNNMLISNANFITLSARNNLVDEINRQELAKLTTTQYQFVAQITGTFDPKQVQADSVITLKQGAQVMFVKNDNVKREYVNGSIGKIIELSEDRILVSLEDMSDKQTLVEVEKQKWEVLHYRVSVDGDKIETETVGTFQQYPLRLAWAITIHKSQGKTFDRVYIDLGTGAFETGQTYVALSRCRTLNGIILKRKLLPTDIIIDERVVEFYQHLRRHLN